MSGSAVDTQDDKSRLPGPISEGPNISVTIMRAGQKGVGGLRPGNGGNSLVVLGQNKLLSEFVTVLGVDVDGVVIGGQGNLC